MKASQMRVRRLASQGPGGMAGRKSLIASLFAALLLAGCASAGLPTSEVLDQKRPPAPSSQTKTADLPPAVQREHQRILAAYGGAYNDKELEGMVSKTVERLVAASQRPDLSYRVTILNSPAVNAFALPSGQLYVTRGLIALSNDNSELASVLAHEMAHVIAQHAAMREDRARQAALVTRVVNDVLSDPQTGALALAKSKIALASFSRTQEFEADGIGVGIASRAGFDPYGAVRFLTSLGRNANLRSTNRPGEDKALDFMSSHPATADRVKSAQLSARQYTAPGSGERERTAYLGAIDGLVYGEDPSEGFVRGRRFLHPKLGFTFVAPEGFSLENTAQAVLGLKDGGREALRLDVVRVSGDQTLAEYLKSGWIENVDAGTIQETTINGLPAATALAKGEDWNFQLYAIRFGSDVYRFIYASKNRSADIDKSFRDSVNTFRRMSVAETESARPLRIKVVAVENGDTIEKMAERMAVNDHPMERFLVLNGLESGERLKPGDRVKIVVE